jgi:type IV secretory pathway TrbD component
MDNDRPPGAELPIEADHLSHTGDRELSIGARIIPMDDDRPNDRPTPAAPAASLPVETEQPILTTLPSGGVWQRSYGLPKVTPQPDTAVTPMRSVGLPSGYGNIVFQSLQRPHLLRGGEWQLSVTNMLVASAFGTAALLTWNWRLLLVAAFFTWPVQWVIRMVGRHDPQWWAIYFRALRKPLIREPHGYASARPKAPPVIIPKPPKFVR